ncbi:hypothetical protein A4A49_29546 [Nicotiana attenuata]|uniref:Uncharacterized protein n=1 Tax=Nicotiana attenuata TaxID=49451 RepID=A0A314KYE7_NICAT|nr:hypothetical protein A4A49_29546 [Nicotiana attenuata]
MKKMESARRLATVVVQQLAQTREFFHHILAASKYTLQGVQDVWSCSYPLLMLMLMLIFLNWLAKWK